MTKFTNKDRLKIGTVLTRRGEEAYTVVEINEPFFYILKLRNGNKEPYEIENIHRRVNNGKLEVREGVV